MKTRVMLVREGRPADVAITGPDVAYRFLRRKAERQIKEHFWRLDLSARNHLVGYELVSVGTLTASLVHPREVFCGAILATAAGIIIAHNHPSGEITPSVEDKEVTRRLNQAGKLLGIPLLDHVIVGDGKYFSFQEAGLL